MTALDENPNPMRYCNRCGAPWGLTPEGKFDPKQPGCHECGSFEFSLEAHGTHEGWKTRRAANH